MINVILMVWVAVAIIYFLSNWRFFSKASRGEGAPRWSRGAGKALLLTVFRFGWLVILPLSFWPDSLPFGVSERSSAEDRFFHISMLIDDSRSMENAGMFGYNANSVQAEIAKVLSNCPACRLTVKRVSDYFPKLIADGFSPLVQTVREHLSQDRSDLFIMLTDAGFSMPELIDQMNSQRRLGSSRQKRMLVGLPAGESQSFHISLKKSAEFFFSDRATTFEVIIEREGPTQADELQLQFLMDGKVVQSEVVSFNKGEKQKTIEIFRDFREQQAEVFEFKLLPSTASMNAYTNEVMIFPEWMTDKIPILHLLGKPGYDGRWMRTFLQSEPKFDMISFFILRDIEDQSASDPKDLSLIPFPTDRLFDKDLHRFKCIVMQNFNLSLFLEPRYQENILKFVREGGRLLFIGGDRALSSEDLGNLADIFPFAKGSSSQRSSPGSGFPAWIPGFTAPPEVLGSLVESPFRLAFPEVEVPPSSSARPLFDRLRQDWKGMQDFLPTMQTRHIFDAADLSRQRSSVLVEGVDAQSGARSPAIVASYPDLGRAVWVLTDELWKIAVADSPLSRDLYNTTIASMMRWLLNEDLDRELLIRAVDLQMTDRARVSLNITGKAVVHLTDEFNLEVCGEQKIASEFPDYELIVLSDQEASLQFSLTKDQAEGLPYCTVKIRVESPSTGRIEASRGFKIPRMRKDGEAPSSRRALENLAEAIYANVHWLLTAEELDALKAEVKAVLPIAQETPPIVETPRLEQKEDYYAWFRSTGMVLLFLSFMLGEALVRIFVRS